MAIGSPEQPPAPGTSTDATDIGLSLPKLPDLSIITNPHTYLRLAMFIAGGWAIYLALRNALGYDLLPAVNPLKSSIEGKSNTAANAGKQGKSLAKTAIKDTVKAAVV